MTEHDMTKCVSQTSYPLIGPDDPPPVLTINENGSAQALLVGDHASRAIPAAMNQLGLTKADLDKHVAYDIGTKGLIQRLSKRLDAPAVMAGYSRLLVDCNRKLDDPTAFPETSDGTLIPANQNLGEKDKMQRAQSFYQPYHAAIERALDRRRNRQIVPAFIAIHSFTPVMGGRQRPWHVGILWDTDPRIPLALMAYLRRHPDNFNIGDNEPYSGRHPSDFTIDHHAEAARLPHVSIEVRQDLIATEKGIDYWADVLGNGLAEILADPALYRLWDRT